MHAATEVLVRQPGVAQSGDAAVGEHPVFDEALVPLRVGIPTDADALVAEVARKLRLPQVGRFEDVAVGIEHVHARSLPRAAQSLSWKALPVPEDIVPFRIEIADAALADLRERLQRTRWPDAETVDDWSQGPVSYVQDVCQYWADKYDWRSAEAR